MIERIRIETKINGFYVIVWDDADNYNEYVFTSLKTMQRVLSGLLESYPTMD